LLPAPPDVPPPPGFTPGPPSPPAGEGRDGGTSAAPPSVPSAVPAMPAPGSVPAAPGTGLGAKIKEFVLALLRQGEARAPTLRMTAAETLAVLSVPADLELARDWIRFEDMERHFPEIAAAALILGRHGDPAEDEPRLLRAAGFLNQS